MSEDPGVYARQSTNKNLDTYEFNKSLDKINHAVEMMRWNIIRKETDIQTRITGIRAWKAEINERLEYIEKLLILEEQR